MYLVYIVASSTTEAQNIAEKVVRDRLAACANIFDGVESVYWWENKLQKDVETAVILKTRESLLPQLEEVVVQLHSYTCPCIVALPVSRVTRSYQQWVINETS
ncbi:MAG: divalent cation tolerance protein CutA [Candidatus Omnitrophica bacterium]|nr:divalent cation tolerance protein CutA [Candidatus Omnitrophota bacterium]